MISLEQRLKVFFASAPQNIYSIQVLEISHSMMPKTYYLWREPRFGQVRINGTTYVDVQPLNIEIKIAGTSNNLDQKFEIRIDTTDIENEFRDALDAIPVDTTEKIKVIYREYLSDDLTTEQAVANLQAESVTYMIGAASISAVSTRLNINRTGELYSTKDIPMMRGFL